MSVRAIRGATTADSNTEDAIKKAAQDLVKEIVKQNNLDSNEIATVIVTMTSDLNAFNASAAIRQGLEWDHVPFFTTQEAEIEKMLHKCIRVLIQYNTEKSQSEMKHVYLNEAANLRPDIVNK